MARPMVARGILSHQEDTGEKSSMLCNRPFLIYETFRDTHPAEGCFAAELEVLSCRWSIHDDGSCQGTFTFLHSLLGVALRWPFAIVRQALRMMVHSEAGGPVPALHIARTACIVVL